MALPYANTSFGAGGGITTELGREGVDIGARPDFWADLEKISRVVRPAAKTTPVAQGRSLARGSSGTGSISRPMAGRVPEAPLVAEGAHSFVQNMWGPNQVGGYVSTGFGPRSVYGGWDPTGGMKGGVAVNPNVPEYRQQFEGGGPGEDPAARSFAMNAALGPSLADVQRSTRVASSNRSMPAGSSAEERQKAPGKSYAGRR